jgi:hypothetical protein
MMVDGATGELLIFAPSPPAGRAETYFAYDGSWWKSSRVEHEDPLAADCNGDGHAEPGYGLLCASGPSWWARPGAIGCDPRTAASACSGGSPNGSLAAGYPAGGAAALAVEGKRAYLARGPRLEIIDLSVPTAPAHIGSARLCGQARDVRVAGSLAYVAADSNLVVLDVSDPAAPHELATVPVCGRARRLALLDGGLVAVETPTGVSFVETLRTRESRLVSRLWLLPRRSGEWTAVHTSGAGCGAVSAAAEIACRWLGGCGGDRGAMDGGGTSAYVGRGSSLLVVDVTDPAAPLLRATVAVGTRIDDLRQEQAAIYINGSRGDFIVVDALSDPPVVFGTHDLADWVRGVRFSPGLACRVTRSQLEVAVTDAP